MGVLFSFLGTQTPERLESLESSRCPAGSGQEACDLSGPCCVSVSFPMRQSSKTPSLEDGRARADNPYGRPFAELGPSPDPKTPFYPGPRCLERRGLGVLGAESEPPLAAAHRNPSSRARGSSRSTRSLHHADP